MEGGLVKMSEGLCWKCREDLENHRPILIDFLHCHHEPKEKQVCWCELEDRVRYRDLAIGIHRVPLIFCPECGKQLCQTK